MEFKKKVLASAVLLGLASQMAMAGDIRWYGSVYNKFLDGNQNSQTGLYNNSEFGSGDIGQGTEFELMFEAKVSEKVEVGGRLKSRFDSNYWSNFGGFGGGCEAPAGGGEVTCTGESNPKEAQYLKLRGIYTRITPGYDWIDSVTIGSNDWGIFDPMTIGKMRYIDRDNGSGILAQGALFDDSLRYDFARISLPSLWAGPQFGTGDLHAQDAAYALQLGGNVGDDLNVTLIHEYVQDQELDANDTNATNGRRLETRFANTVTGLKLAWDGLDFLSTNVALYNSSFDIDDSITEARWTPTPSKSVNDTSLLLNVELSDFGVEDLTVSAQYFDIGKDYFSMMASRREADVLLTEGYDAAWGWSRPNYNSKSAGTANVGYGGWRGTQQQVVAVNADNEFTDFDEAQAYSVIGWKGLTVIPRYTIADVDLSLEITLLDFNDNEQACGSAVKADCAMPGLDGVSGWGVGGDYRSVLSPYQDKSTNIFVLRAEHQLDVLGGIDLSGFVKFMGDEDKRVTSNAALADAYSNASTVIAHHKHDDREADYTSFGLSVGAQLHQDLYVKAYYDVYEVDLMDGTIDNVPTVFDGWEQGGGWVEYQTGQHSKNIFGLQADYIISGIEVGAKVEFIHGTYDPEYYQGNADGSVTEVTGAAAIDALVAGSGWNGNIDAPSEDFDYSQYRMKVFVKTQF